MATDRNGSEEALDSLEACLLDELTLQSTIIHEATHFRDVLGTRDHGYGVEYCKQFAIEDPEKAVENAE